MQYGSISIHATSIKNIPLLDANIIIVSGPTHKDLGYLTDKNGDCVIKRLIPGNYKIMLSAKNINTIKECIVCPDRETKLIINLNI